VTDFRRLLSALAQQEVRFIVISGAAAIAQLITAKRAAGRPKDLQAIAELEALEDNGQQ